MQNSLYIPKYFTIREHKGSVVSYFEYILFEYRFILPIFIVLKISVGHLLFMW